MAGSIALRDPLTAIWTSVCLRRWWQARFSTHQHTVSLLDTAHCPLQPAFQSIPRGIRQLSRAAHVDVPIDFPEIVSTFEGHLQGQWWDQEGEDPEKGHRMRKLPRTRTITSSLPFLCTTPLAPSSPKCSAVSAETLLLHALPRPFARTGRPRAIPSFFRGQEEAMPGCCFLC